MELPAPGHLDITPRNVTSEKQRIRTFPGIFEFYKAANLSRLFKKKQHWLETFRKVLVRETAVPRPVLSEGLQQDLLLLLAGDIEAIETLTGHNLDIWRKSV